MYNLKDWVTTVFVILAEQSGVHRGAMPNQPVYCLGEKNTGSFNPITPITF